MHEKLDSAGCRARDDTGHMRCSEISDTLRLASFVSACLQCLRLNRDLEQTLYGRMARVGWVVLLVTLAAVALAGGAEARRLLGKHLESRKP